MKSFNNKNQSSDNDKNLLIIALRITAAATAMFHSAKAALTNRQQV